MLNTCKKLRSVAAARSEYPTVSHTEAVAALWGAEAVGSGLRIDEDCWVGPTKREIEVSHDAVDVCNMAAAGYSNPNHYRAVAWRRLATAIREYLTTRAARWPTNH